MSAVSSVCAGPAAGTALPETTNHRRLPPIAVAAYAERLSAAAAALERAAEDLAAVRRGDLIPALRGLHGWQLRRMVIQLRTLRHDATPTHSPARAGIDLP